MWCIRGVLFLVPEKRDAFDACLPFVSILPLLSPFQDKTSGILCIVFCTTIILQITMTTM